MNEEVKFKICGRWHDTLVYPDGRKENGPQGDFEWGHNQIQNSCASLLAALLKGEASYGPAQWMAVGEGDVAWDLSPPTVKSYAQTTLQDETFRKQIPLANIWYLDPDKDPVSGPTNTIQFNVTLAAGEATGTLREFALFGGNATNAPNSGLMVNWISHARIDKDAVMEIQRKVRITFHIIEE